MTRLNVVGNILLTVIARLLFNAHISDICTGLWGYQGYVIRDLELSADGFAIEADMFAECSRNGFCMAELPITYRAREASRAKLSSLRDGLKIAAFLFKKRLNQTKAQKVRSGAKHRGEHG